MATQDVEEVRMAGRDHTVCSSCADKKIPMLSGLPGEVIGGRDV
ncbi:MAG: hypothetical protein SVW77_02720 [Candidatus Nanohaloarchaea archaeon]|nr:hypothetical protein [Candidatus Nanohaloarchaea archaeon]